MRAASLLLGQHSLAALAPSTHLAHLHILLANNRIDDAAELVDSHRRSLEANLAVDPDEADELAYMYQLIGFKCFSETLFESAGTHLFNGALDPRILVSYYPDLYASLFHPDDHVDVFAGVQEYMPSEQSVDDLIRNYSPHLHPNTRDAPSAVELARVLNVNAREMLLDFLAKSRTRAIVERRPEDVRIDVACVVDTVLVKLYAHFNRPQNLAAILSTPNHVILPEIEPSLRSLGLYLPLADLYKRHGQDEKLLELYASIAQGEYTDPEIPHPLGDMVALLESRKSKDKTQRSRWGLWMLKQGDVDRGMRLLIPPDTGKTRIRDRDREEDQVLLDQITEANDQAGRRFLEYLVLKKRNTSSDLHTRLALSCLDDLFRCIKDEPTCKLWRAKVSSYTSTRLPHSPSPSKSTQTQTSFFSYFASTTPDSPSKRTRLKAVLLLAGSSLYDAARLKAKLYEWLSGTPIPLDEINTPSSPSPTQSSHKHSRAEPSYIFALESAILDGKLGNHSAALSTLVHDLRDSTSAEAYCTLGGEVVPAKVALAIVESERGQPQGSDSESTATEVKLEEWYWGLFEPPPKGAAGGGGGRRGVVDLSALPAMVRQKSVREEVKRDLLMNLVEVYMSDATIGMDRATKLLDAQGVNLDVFDVIPHVPSQWPIISLSTFLARHFRRTVHAQYENQCVKNVCAGQNLAVRDAAHEIIREQGYLLEEPDDGDVGGSEVLVEKVPVEKAGVVVVEQDVNEKSGTGLGLIMSSDEEGGG